ncbi:uncharacterized protein HaLaN_11237, partial [Haematococcus lacustris]
MLLARGLQRCLSSGSYASIADSGVAPVIIVGAGPSGLTTALWLARFGVPSVIVERQHQPTQHPQAHYINNRTMEVEVWMQACMERCINGSCMPHLLSVHTLTLTSRSIITSSDVQVLRPLAGLSAAIRQHSPALDEWRKFVYCISMTGQVLGEVDHFAG